MAEQIQSGNQNYDELCTHAHKKLADAGFKPDYIQIREASRLQQPSASDRKLVILAAAYLNNVRLIDNIQVSI